MVRGERMVRLVKTVALLTTVTYAGVKLLEMAADNLEQGEANVLGFTVEEYRRGRHWTEDPANVEKVRSIQERLDSKESDQAKE